MGLGVAYSIGIEIFMSQYDVNKWLDKNVDTEIVDIKFSSTENHPAILIIYRKDR